MSNENKIKDETTELVNKPKPSLTSQIEDLNQKLEVISGQQKKDSKGFKIPASAKSKLRKAIKKQRIGVVLLKNNRFADIITAPLKEGMVYVENSWRDCSEATVWMFKGKHPIIVLPEYSLRPIGNQEYLKCIETMSDQQRTAFIVQVLERKEHDKPSFGDFNWKVILLVLAGAGVGLYVLFGGQT